MTTVWNLLKGIFASIQLVDVLDILILTYLIYQLILLAQRTRAVQLIRGIIVLLVCYTVAQHFGFKTLNFVFSNVLQFGIIAAIVVFQPELRRMLENVGRKTGTLPFFGQHRTGEESAAMWSEAINDICASVEAMSMDKTGALIAIELKTGLSEIAATGTTVDARLSSELLETIFYEGCPLHDGAVIVRDGRVYAAGCYLPLSANTEIARELGTRHRAALGLSENSDAVVIVVSEETGVISVAQNGILVRRLDRISLMRILKRELIPEPKKRGQSSEEQDN